MPDVTGSGPRSRIKRRDVLKAAGIATSVGLSGLAGCSSIGSGGAVEENSISQEDLGVFSYEEDNWPDLSGKQVHFLTDEGDSKTQKFFNSLGREFEDKTGATFVAEFAAFGKDVEERAMRLLQAGNPPEVFMTSPTQATLQLNQDILQPVTNAAEAVFEDFGETPDSATLTENDHHYILPRDTNAHTNWYREDLADPELLAGDPTWDDQRQWAEQAHETIQNGDGENLPDHAWYIPASRGWCPEGFVYSHARTNGATLAARKDGEVKVTMAEGENRQRWIETMNWLKGMHQDFAPAASDAGCQQHIQSFPTGVTGSVVQWGSRPKIQSIRQETPFKAKVRPGHIPKGEQRVTSGVFKGAVSFKGADMKATNAFLQMMYSKKWLKEFAKVTPLHNLSLYKKVHNGIDWRSVVDDAWSDEDIRRVAEIPETMRSLASETDPLNPYGGVLLAQEKTSLFMYQVLHQGKDPDGVIDQVAGDLAKALQKNKGD